MEQKYKYFAFISYSHKDSEWAKWLQHELEYYKLPATLNGRPGLPKSFRPVFRDEDEFAGGPLTPQTTKALASSNFLIIICSPNSAKSEYVDREIHEFIELKNDGIRRIFPLIVEGIPHSNDDTECFPKAILDLKDDNNNPVELIAGDIKATGKEHAFIKILAGTLNEKNIEFSDLWNRYEREKIEEERREREKRDMLLRTQSRFVVEKANTEDDEAKKLALILNVMPRNIDLPQRPYTHESGTELMSLLNATNLERVFQHDDTVNTATFSPDGKKILTAADDKTACLWDVETGKKIFPPFNHEGNVKIAVFSPDGKKILTAADDKTACLWDAETGKELFPLFNLNGRINTAVFSPDGKKILTAVDDTTLCLLDAETAIKRVPLNHEGNVKIAKFSPDGTKILTVTDDKTAHLWDVETGKKLFPPFNHDGNINTAAFSPDEKKILTAADDKTACLWDAETGEKKYTFEHDDIVNSALFSPNGSMILTVSKDNTACLWDAETRDKIFPPFKGIGNIKLAVFSPDGKRILTSSDFSSNLWDVETGKQILPVSYRHNGRSIVYSKFTADGGNILTLMDISSYKKKNFYKFYIFDVEKGNVVFTFECTKDYANLVAISPGKKVLTISDKTARLWNLKTGRLTIRGVIPEFSLDGKKILTVASSHGKNKTAWLWDAETGEKIHSFDHEGNVNTAEFTPDGKKILTAENYKTAWLWDAETEKPLFPPFNLGGWLRTAKFSPDGKKILTAADDKTACLWDVETGKKIFPPFNHEGNVKIAVFSPDGKKIKTTVSQRKGFKTVFREYIWDVETGDKIPFNHESNVKIAVFSPDGKKIFTATDDETACLWDAETEKPLFPPFNLDDSISAAKFSPDGKRILTKSVIGNTGCLWDAETGKKISPPFDLKEDFSTAKFSPDGTKILMTKLIIGKFACLRDAETGKKIFPPFCTNSVAIFSLDGKKILTVTDDKTAHLWDVETGEIVLTFNHDDIFYSNSIESVNGAKFSPDGQKILTTTTMEKVIIWNINIQGLINRGYEILNNYELSSEDKQKYYLE